MDLMVKTSLVTYKISFQEAAMVMYRAIDPCPRIRPPIPNFGVMDSIPLNPLTSMGVPETDNHVTTGERRDFIRTVLADQ